MKENRDFKLSWEDIKKYLSKRENINQLVQTFIPYLILYGLLYLVFNSFDITPESIRETLSGKGAILIPTFIFFQMVGSLTPLPDLPFNAAAVLFFEPWASLLIIWLGMWLASIINFYVARKLGREYIERKYPQTTKWIDQFAGKYGFETLVTARSFTFVPFDLIAYAAGISNISVAKFGTASIFGLFPVAVSAVFVGLAFIAGNVVNSFWLFGVSALISIAFGFIARSIRRYRERKEN